MRGLRRLIPYPNPWTAQPPVFVCVNESTRQRYGTRLRKDPYEYCQQSGGFGLYLFGWKYIFLCDKLFTLRPAPLAPPLKNCPHVIGNRFTVPAEMGRLADFQTYVLIHEMMHFYLLRDSLGWNSIPKEAYASNVCVNFDMKTSLRNPMNLQYFVASKSSQTRVLPLDANQGIQWRTINVLRHRIPSSLRFRFLCQRWLRRSSGRMLLLPSMQLL